MIGKPAVRILGTYRKTGRPVVERTHRGFLVRPDLVPYVTLLNLFLSRRLTPAEFQDILIPLFKRDPVSRSKEIYEALNDVFLAAEALTADDPYRVSEEELYGIAENSLRCLNKAIVSALQ